jgi:glutathione S-transferase
MRAKGLGWEPVKVDLFKTEQYDPKYLKLNPKGVVPTLVQDGKPVIESTFICQYIDETFKQPPYLVPAESVAAKPDAIVEQNGR